MLQTRVLSLRIYKFFQQLERLKSHVPTSINLLASKIAFRVVGLSANNMRTNMIKFVKGITLLG